MVRILVHPIFGGKLDNYDQLFVEMGSLATFLILTKKDFWNNLTTLQQKNIFQWLNQINHKTIPPTNWLFFRILVNTFFRIAKINTNNDAINTDLKSIDSYYLDDGWYFDGYKNQIDYYISWGMQYYGILFSKLTPDQNEPHIQLFQKRGAKFAATFKDWFTDNGTALPFGRSLVYRFAQSSFWAVAAFAHLNMLDVTLGQAKHLLLSNMRQWFKKPIFTEDGFLSIGYSYPNLNMAEGYNAPGSPYWAMKNFIILALPDDDIFWKTDEETTDFPKKVENQYSRMLLIHGDNNKELQAFTAGQHSHEHAHGASKYEKFVYSTTFGFSVRKDSVLPKQGAFDNTLAISDTKYNYQTVFGYNDFKIHDNYVYGLWRPWSTVEIKTFIIPYYPWHFRVHIINSNRELNIIEGSFSTPADGNLQTSQNINSCFYKSSIGTTGVISFNDTLKAELGEPEPNTNLCYPKTILPQIVGHLSSGQHVLISAYLGTPHNIQNLPTLNKPILTNNQIVIELGQNQKTQILKELN